MNLYERRMKILSLLSLKRNETIGALAREFNVSEMTISRDLDFLSLNYPIYTKQGAHGGVFLMDGYYTSNSYLTLEQENSLKRLKILASLNDKKIIEEILSKFSMPKVEEEI